MARARPAKPPAPPDDRSARSALRRVTLVSLLLIGILAGLFQLEVPLGKPGTLTYLYSPIVELRLLRAPLAIALAGLAAFGIRQLGRARTRAGLGALLLATVGAGIWAYAATPKCRNQIVFNMQSPAHDGAFLLEAEQIRDAHEYCRDFPLRARRPPQEMRGTRVISNPPGTTLLIYGVRRVLEGWPALDAWMAGFSRDEDLDPVFRRRVNLTLASSALLTLAWIASGPLLFLAARTLLPTPGAATVAFCAVTTPMALLFAPGKDVAQLFTLALPLWFWLSAVRSGSGLRAAAAGAAAAAGLVMSLVHAWLAAIVLGATLLAAANPASRRRLIAVLLPAAASGALAAGLMLYAVCRLNLPAALLATAAAQAEVTRGPGAMPFAWQLLGVPVGALFAGPATWVLLGTARQTQREPSERVQGPAGSALPIDPGRFGTSLVVLALLVMFATIGFTNMETPRLWIPFLPLLLLGSALRGEAAPSRGTDARGLAALVFAQLSVAAVQWAFMDVRESEMRLISRRFFG